MKKINVKKFKYGSVAVVFTAIFIAFVVLFNVIISVVNKNGALDIDVTSEAIFTVSDQSLNLLKSNNVPLTIYFLRDRDQIAEDNESYMLNLVDSYTSNFSWIDVEYVDLDRNPKFKDKYTKSTSETLSNTSLIVECSATNEYRVITVQDYFLLEQSYYQSYVTGFQGELALTSAILNVLTPDELIAAFETGHNELSATTLKSFLEKVGYQVIDINLREEDIDEKISLLVINNPKQDFGGYIEGTSSKSEIEKLVDYIESPEKNMLVFMSPDSPELKEFEEFLAVYGVAVERNVIVDEQNSASGTAGIGIYGVYAPTGNDEYVDEITGRVDAEYKTVFNRAAPITILFDEWKNGIVVSPIVTTSKTAYYTEGENKVDGQYNLMTLSTKGTSKLVVCSTSYYNTFIETTTYANRDLLYSIAQSFGAKNVTPDIPIKLLDETKAQFDISATATKTWGIIITVIPAAIVLIIAAVALTKRRHL